MRFWPAPHDWTGAFTEHALAHPRRWLGAIAVVTLTLGVGLRSLELRTDGASLYPRHHPTIQFTMQDRTVFNEDDEILLLLSAPPGTQYFATRTGLRDLKQLHDSILVLHGVNPRRVRSLASILDPQPGMPWVSIPCLLDDIPDDEAAFNALLERIRRSPLVEGLFRSPDADFATIRVPLLRDADRTGVVASVERWARQHRHPDRDIRLMGPVTAEVLLGKQVLADLLRLIPVMLGVIGVLLYFGLRSIGGVVAAFASLIVVLVWSLGLMALFQVPVTLVTTILPVVLLSATMTDQIHLFDRFRRNLASSLPAESMRLAIREVSVPVVMTSLTTAAAFASFASSSLPSVRHFGMFTSVGVLIALGLNFTLTPALAVLIPRAWFPVAAPGAGVRPDLVAERRVSRLHRRGVWWAALVVVLVGPGCRWLRIQDSWLQNFAGDSPLVAAEHDFNAHFWGSFRCDVVLASEEAGYFQKAAGLRIIEELTGIARRAPSVGGVVSPLTAYRIVADTERESRQVTELPPETILRYSGLLQRVQTRIDLDQYLQGTGHQARVRLFVRNADYSRGEELRGYLDGEIGRVLAGKPVRFHLSGDLPAAQATVGSVVSDMLRSAAWTIAVLLVLLVVSFGEVRTAVLCLIPLVTALLLVLGTMGYTGIPFGIATSMFVAVTLGVAIDYALHFVWAYRTVGYRLDAESRLAATFERAGRSVRWNAIAFGLGVLVLVFSESAPNQRLGILLSAVTLVSYATTVLFLPWFLPHTIRRGSLASQRPRSLR